MSQNSKGWISKADILVIAILFLVVLSLHLESNCSNPALPSIMKILVSTLTKANG